MILRIDKHLRARMRIVIWKQWKNQPKEITGDCGTQTECPECDGNKQSVGVLLITIKQSSKQQDSNKILKRNSRKALTH
jgi:hypothetical protein